VATELTEIVDANQALRVTEDIAAAIVRATLAIAR